MIKVKNAVIIGRDDNVAVAIEPINKGDRIMDVVAAMPIPQGHKIAIKAIDMGEQVIKYDHPIGTATEKIAIGTHVHSHNLTTGLRGIVDYAYNPGFVPAFTPSSQETFMGYVRKCGRVGIRNEIWIINTVNCVNKTAEKLAQESNMRHGGRVDGVFAFGHPHGCSQLGFDLLSTQTILSNLAKHPNAAGVLVLGLGCENNNIDAFKQVLGEVDESRIKFLNTQDVTDEFAAGMQLIDELVDMAETFSREPVPVDKLTIGLKCGGSDGLSGITANVLVGSLSDAIVRRGGTCLLTEVPEMFGAETILMNRCVNEEVFRKSVDLINGFKSYFMDHGQEIYENPSPGNIEGGITTLEEKSLGCTQKGGSCQVVDVLEYGEGAKKPGLNLLQGPGNDIVAVTNLVAAGAHIVLFTTGRGTPLGGPVPTVKISSNTALQQKKPTWVDFDAGVLLAGDGTRMDNVTDDLLDYILRLASGKELTKNEVNDYREIGIFKDGVTL